MCSSEWVAALETARQYAQIFPYAVLRGGQKLDRQFLRSAVLNATLYLLEKVAIATVGIHSVVPASHPSASIGLGTDRNGTGTLVSADRLIITVNYMLMS